MTREYLRTLVAPCSNCDRLVPGHVIDVGLADEVPVWTCPACEHTTAPENLTDPEEVEV